MNNVKLHLDKHFGKNYKGILIDMHNKLDKVWKADTWSLLELPLVNKEIENKIRKWNGAKYLKFKCSEKMKIELQVVFYKLLDDKTWTVQYISGNRKQLHILTEWMNSTLKSVSELVLEDIDYWKLSLRTFMVETGTYKEMTRTMINASQQVVSYPREPLPIYMLSQVYKTLIKIFDNRSEYEKEIWDVRNIGIKYNKTSGNHTLNFKSITQDWLKILTKNFIKYHLSKHSFSTANNKLNALKHFSNFIEKETEISCIEELNQHIIFNFKNYISSLKISTGYKSLILCGVRDFIETGTYEEWFVLHEAIYVDIPKLDITKSARYIPKNVLKQLNHHLSELREDISRIVLILQVCGMRISEALLLPFSCLSRDVEGDYFLRYYQEKLKKKHSIPVPKEVVEIIEEQKKYVINKYGQKTDYLFPSKLNKPILTKNFNENLNRLAIKKNIIDDNGNIFHFHSHQFRHTVGTSLINLGVPQHIVQKYLGHESPEMTSTYAQIYDQTLKEEFLKTKGQLVDIYGKKQNWNEQYSDDLSWLKKNILAQSLPDGYCSIPVIAGPCKHANACLTCEHFRTDATFKNVLEKQLEETSKLLDIAKENNWLRQIETNTKILETLKTILKAI